MPLRGERLAKPSYAILRSIGDGAVGDAWKAEHEVYGCTVVQKRYSVIGMEDAAAFREPRILSRMEHDHVVRVLEAQWDPEMEKAITFVTVFCEGGSIADALGEGYRFSVAQSLRLTIHLLSALAYAHNDPALSIVHRDVKPGNAFLDADRTSLFLGDWGSAAEMDDRRTVAGIEGTLLYKAPEGGPPNTRIGVAADIYGTAMTLFEMLNGPLPYGDLDPEVLDRRVTRGHTALPPSAFVFAPHISDAVRALVRKGMRSNPQQRFLSAAAYIRAIEKVSGIDWIHTSGTDMDGVWEGTWPLRRSSRWRRRYRVESIVLQGGPDRGRRRLCAYQAVSTTGQFARFGVPDETVDVDDRSAVERFFAAVEAKAAQRVPASR